MEREWIETVDYHTAGEPLRIVTGGLPPIHGETLLERRRYLREHLDPYRRLLMWEPRGHADMYGAVLTPPVSDDADIGVLFLHNEGYSTMCGHGIIALVHAALEEDLFEVADPDAIRIDTPAGLIVARANRDASGRVESVTFRNVPSFVLEMEYSVRVDDRAVDMTIAYGGAFYAYVDAAAQGFSLQPAEAPQLRELGKRIRRAVATHYRVEHPQGDGDLNFLYGTVFCLRRDSDRQWRNACVFADGEFDRSPTGTGVSGHAAILWTRGLIELDQAVEVEGPLGTTFSVRCVEETTVAGQRAVVPEVTGQAVLTGRHRFCLDPRDPLPGGFLIR
ncbi:proline racemase family protein [Elongatibacter sediminis]|uniref:Proline racemase family protein n=1 Tax=Elongatibacter sediminis TaxID=3119006 RepID=A0AAW9RKT6_9GAMM